MKRPLAVAVPVSAALHAALLVLVLDANAPVPEPSPQLTFELEPSPAEARALHEAAAASDAESAAGEGARVSPSPPLERPEPPPDAPVPVEPRLALHAAAHVAPLPVDEQVPPSPPQPELPAPQSAPLLPSHLTAQRARAALSAPMSASERAMLDERAEAWAQNFASIETAAEVAWEQDGQRYVATFTHHPSDTATGTGEVLVQVVTEADGEQRSARIKLRQLAFSRFAQFVDRWDHGVMLHDDAVDGWLHSNSRLMVSSTRDARPELLGKVTAAHGIETRFETPTRRDSIFRGGLETGVRRIAMPKAALPFADTSPPSPDRMRRFETTVWIEFQSDGTYRWSTGEDSGNETLPAAPFYLLGAADAEVHVKGTVKGKVLVYTPATVVIDGALRYALDPRTAAHSGDYLGLVADETVVIAPPNVTGPGDLDIDASIYARRRFVVRNYGKKEHATLAIYGSLTAGSLSATEPRYRTRIEFDRRLESERPPGFPLTDRYEVESWGAEWTATRH